MYVQILVRVWSTDVVTVAVEAGDDVLGSPTSQAHWSYPKRQHGSLGKARQWSKCGRKHCIPLRYDSISNENAGVHLLTHLVGKSLYLMRELLQLEFYCP